VLVTKHADAVTIHPSKVTIAKIFFIFELIAKTLKSLYLFGKKNSVSKAQPNPTKITHSTTSIKAAAGKMQ
jgi:hypothetical protein